MPILSKLAYGVDILILGMVIYAGMTDNTALAITGLGIYALGNVIENMRNESEAYSSKD